MRQAEGDEKRKKRQLAVMKTALETIRDNMAGPAWLVAREALEKAAAIASVTKRKAAG